MVEYRIEWLFLPNSKGGQWGKGKWTTHTELPGMNHGMALQALDDLRLTFLPEVREYFRLERQDGN